MNNSERLHKWIMGLDTEFTNLEPEEALKRAFTLFSDCNIQEVSAITIQVMAFLTDQNKKNDDLRQERVGLGLELTRNFNLLVVINSDEELLQCAKECRRILARRNEIDEQISRDNLASIRGRFSTVTTWLGNRKVSEAIKATSEAIKTTSETKKIRLQVAEEEKRAAEYALLLAQGKKRQTLQQAYANGDFIEVAEDNQIYLPSSTGKRLGARS